MSDALRGMRGIMIDIMRRPAELLAAEDKLARLELEFAINYLQGHGHGQGLPPAARGSDGFMSLKQFETLYWKKLKHVHETLVENGITPIVF